VLQRAGVAEHNRAPRGFATELGTAPRMKGLRRHEHFRKLASVAEKRAGHESCWNLQPFIPVCNAASVVVIRAPRSKALYATLPPAIG
jgi:hypothetical protein